eukprot:92814-Chlamydomonas_euryale.AAC.1
MDVGTFGEQLITISTPAGWWDEYGSEAGKLQEVAMRMLSIPGSSASGERVFSALKHIWSAK